jgi:hypothetical protein
MRYKSERVTFSKFFCGNADTLKRALCIGAMQFEI